MKQRLTLITGFILSFALLHAQTPLERVEKMDRELLEKEMRMLSGSGHQDPAWLSRNVQLRDPALKSAMADIGNSPDWNWIRSFTGSGGADINDFVVDGSNNVYACGVFSDSMRILGTTLVSTGLWDVFVVKIGSFGNLSWIRTLSALPDENLYAGQIALVPGGVVIEGQMDTETISGGGTTVSRTGDEEGYLAKLSLAGAVDWIKPHSDAIAYKLSADADGNLYKDLRGNLQKYDPSGDFLWQTHGGGAVHIYDFTMHDGEIWVSGAVQDSGSVVGDSVYHGDWWDMDAYFISKLNPDGSFGKVHFIPAWIWDLNYGSQMYLEMDEFGHLMIAGNRQSDIFFKDTTLWWNGDVYRARLDTNMNVDWVEADTSNMFHTVYEDLIKLSGNEYVIQAEFQDTIRFGDVSYAPGYENYGYYFGRYDTNGTILGVNDYDYRDFPYRYVLKSGGTIYYTSYDQYDHWLHKETLGGALLWGSPIQVWNNGGDASIWYTMDVDEDGNLYAQGNYRGSVRMFGAITKGRGVFFIKFRNDGEVEWIKTMENPLGSPSGIKVDNQGNVYAWGSFEDYIKIEGQEFHNHDPDNADDMYLVKLDLDGELKFVKQFDGKGPLVGVGGIDLSPENDILISGQFLDTLYLGAYELISSGAYDMFIAKISPSGNVKWARSYGGTGSDWARSIASDSSGYIYFTGMYWDSIAFDSVILKVDEGYYDFYLAKMDPAGKIMWVKRGGPDNYYIRGHAIALHGDQVYIQGIAYTIPGQWPTLTFGETVFQPQFQRNSFLASYDTSGQQLWVKLFQINNYGWPLYQIDTDEKGNVYAGGIFLDTLVVESYLVEGSGGDDYYILKYNPAGQFQWLKTSETGNTGEVNMFCAVVFEEDVVLVGGRIIGGTAYIGGQEIQTASSASFAGLIGEDIIGCTMQLSVSTTDEEFGEGNGAAGVTVTDGTAPYWYEWSTGDTGVAAVDSLFAGTYQVMVVDAKGCEDFEVFSINILDGPVISLEESGNASCNGAADGYIDISVTGGTEPYTYFWDNGYTTQDLTNLSAAPYAVTVTDAEGRFASRDFVIEEPKPLDVSYTIKQASCPNGTDGAIEVFTSGGTKDYSWSWNTFDLTESITGKTAGKYTLIVTDANDCELELEIALSQKDAPIVETEYIEPATCDVSDGAARVRVLNALGNETFQWADGSTVSEITGKSSGSYFVNVFNSAGCKTVHLVDIPEKKPLDNQICLVTVDTVIGSNLIVWEKVDEAIEYHIYRETTAKDVYLLAGTTLGQNLSVFVDTVANPLIRSYRYKIAAVDECGNESFLSHLHKTVHMTISPGLTDQIMNIRWDDYVGEDFESFEVWRYTKLFSWELLATLPSNLRSYTDFQVPPGLVFYNVRVPFENPCEPTGNLTTKAGTGPYQHSLSNMDDNKLKSQSDTTGSDTTGSDTTTWVSYNQDQFYVYPNPTDGFVTIWSESFAITEGEIYVSDLSGRMVMNRRFRENLSGRLTLDLQGQPAGAYIVQLRTRGKVYFQKLVKR